MKRRSLLILMMVMMLVVTSIFVMAACETREQDTPNPDDSTDHGIVFPDDNNNSDIDDPQIDKPEIDKPVIDTDKKPLSPSEIYEKVDKSVVFVLIETLNGYASGTGFFIDNNGTFVTNYHVIEDGKRGAIQTSDGKAHAIVNVIGYDEEKDIAILSTDAKNTSPVTMANSDSVKVGESVYAIGYPEAFKLGFMSSTFTSGMVSMRRVVDGNEYIQATVDITHGNSGGPLMNVYGEIVGITTLGLKINDIDYMNLSIPINKVGSISRDVNESLLITTKRHYPVIIDYYVEGEVKGIRTAKYESTIEPPSISINFVKIIDWYTDENLTQKFDFNTKIISNITLYAKVEHLDGYGLIVEDGIITGCDKSVKEMVIPTYYNNSRKITGIANRAFEGCSSLTSVIIPESVTSIGSYVFSGCSSLTIYARTSYEPSGWNSDWNYHNSPVVWDCKNNQVADDGCIYVIDNDVRYALKDGVATVVGQPKNIAGDIVIPSSITYKGTMYSVTSIDNYAFSGCSSLTSILIPEGVTSINWGAFSDCNSLTSITIHDSVTSIGDSAFNGCGSLTSIVVDSNNTKYTSRDSNGNECNCIIDKDTNTLIVGCMSTVIPSGATSIGYAAFSHCSSLTSITIPSSVISIGKWAFSGCSSLASITIPSGVTSIEQSAFYGCSLLTIYAEAASVPRGWDFGWNRDDRPVVWGYNNITTNANYDYVVHDSQVCLTKYKGSKTNIIIPQQIDGMDVVGIGTIFANNENITNVVIPSSVTRIDNYAFKYCSYLTSIIIPSSVTSIGEHAFSGCYSLESITIPSSVTSIGVHVFNGCSSLNKIIFANDSQCVTIGYSAFSGCSSLRSIIIPSSVTSIGKNAFSGCYSLTIYAEAASQPAGWVKNTSTNGFDNSWNPENRRVVWGYKG